MILGELGELYEWAAGSIGRDFDPAELTWLGCADGVNDELRVRAKLMPCLYAQDNNPNLSTRKILLIGYVLVGSQEQIEAILFRRAEQIAVG